jgi:hypothetical protein
MLFNDVNYHQNHHFQDKPQKAGSVSEAIAAAPSRSFNVSIPLGV